MDVDKYENLALPPIAIITIFWAVVVILSIPLCCWMVPISCRNSTIRSNNPQSQNEETIEMEEVNKEINRATTSFENEMEQSNKKNHPQNTNYKA